jgi:hypothetical protein
MYFICQEREKKGKKQTIIGDNSITISWHASLRVEEDTIEHPRRQRKTIFGYRVVSHAHPEDADATHSLACNQHTLTTFWFKYSKVNMKNTKTLLMTLLITQNTCVKA